MDNDTTFALAVAALKRAKVANERIDALPLPMIFKGTLGTGGTITTLPTASSSNEGFVYIVITDGTYAGQTAKAGDTFVSDGSSWVLVPSANEPSVIDDSVISTALTWSSDKISTELQKKADASTILTGTLTAGQTSIQFTDTSITANALISIYTSADEWYISRSVSGTTLTITFDEQASDMAVTVEVK